MPYMISSRSVANSVSLSVSKSKLVYSSLISVDNKVKWICLLSQQQLVQFLSVIHSTYLASSACLRNKREWAHETVNHFVRNFAKSSPILKILSPADWVIDL